MKILIVALYLLTQFTLVMIIVGLKLKTNITEFDGYVVGFFIVNYGFLMGLSDYFRRKYWPGK